EAPWSESMPAFATAILIAAALCLVAVLSSANRPSRIREVEPYALDRNRSPDLFLSGRGASGAARYYRLCGTGGLSRHCGQQWLWKVHFLQGPKRSDPPVHQRRFFGARPCLQAG